MHKRLSITLSAITLVFIIGAALYFVGDKNQSPAVGEIGFMEYVNPEYGFSVSLPESWRGYSVTIDKWTGYAAGDELGDVPVADGPVVSIHNPKWTADNMYQDIPVMVFTPEQWDSLQTGQFHIGAAPINPSELARNSKYIFALPARYNYAFPSGYEEVEEILRGRPVTAF